MIYEIEFKLQRKPMFSNFSLEPGEIVLCETDEGVWRGRVVEEKKGLSPDGKVLRPIYPGEERKIKDLEKMEEDAFQVCLERIKFRELPMKLVEVEREWEGRKIKFYYLADGRIDFRQLVRDLARVYRTRIEMRQISVREYARFLGGFGVCGRPVCCSVFMKKRISVTIQMAREQNLFHDPRKLSGICGRLMCCLKYELDFYREEKSKYPELESMVETPKGPAKVIHFNMLRKIIKVEYEDGTVENLPLNMVRRKKIWWLLPRK